MVSLERLNQILKIVESFRLRSKCQITPLFGGNFPRTKKVNLKKLKRKFRDRQTCLE